MRSRRKSYVLAKVGAVLLGTAVAVAPATARPDPFRIGFNTWVGYGPLYVARDTGILRQHGLDVELVRLEGTGERRAALLSKRLEALGSTIDDFVVGLSQGVNAKMVAVLDESDGADGIVAKKEINSVRDLRGKRIAVQPGFVNHFFLLDILDKVGIPPTGFQLVPMEPDKAAAALIAGDVDAAVTWEPHLSVIKNLPQFHVILTTRDDLARHIIFDNLLIRDDVASTRKEDVIALLQSWFEALAYMHTHPAESHKIIGAAFSLSEKDVTDALSGVYFPSLKENISFIDSPVAPGAVPSAQTAMALYVEVGLIKGIQDSGEVFKSNITPMFLKEIK